MHALDHSGMTDRGQDQGGTSPPLARHTQCGRSEYVISGTPRRHAKDDFTITKRLIAIGFNLGSTHKLIGSPLEAWFYVPAVNGA